MVAVSDLPVQSFNNQRCYRLVNSKYPPINLFDDVAESGEFESVYNIQALTNPRIQNEQDLLDLVPRGEIPNGITGVNYAVAPFFHLNRHGSRFSAGEYGIYYAAKELQTAIAETRYHQELYFKKVTGLKYDRVIMRTLCTFFTAELVNIKAPLISKHNWYHKQDYTQAQKLGKKVKNKQLPGIWYGSVRNKYADCYALFSPQWITQVIQGSHYEYIWDGFNITHQHLLS